MCDQTQVTYKPDDIVWVKLSNVWWPAQVQDQETLDEDVTQGLKKKPLAVVKFFNEDFYEFIKNLDQIYHYNCLKKNEFIQKGLDLCRPNNSRTISSSMIKFPEDVRQAEIITGGNPDICDDPKFKGKTDDKIESEKNSEYPKTPKSAIKRSNNESLSEPPKKNIRYSLPSDSHEFKTPIARAPIAARLAKTSPQRQAKSRLQGNNNNNNNNDSPCGLRPTVYRPVSREVLEKIKKKNYQSNIRIQPTPSSTPPTNQKKLYSCFRCDDSTNRLSLLIHHYKAHALHGLNVPKMSPVLPPRITATTTPPSGSNDSTPKIRREKTKPSASKKSNSSPSTPKKKVNKNEKSPSPKDPTSSRSSRTPKRKRGSNSKRSDVETNDNLRKKLLQDWDESDEDDNSGSKVFSTVAEIHSSSNRTPSPEPTEKDSAVTSASENIEVEATVPSTNDTNTGKIETISKDDEDDDADKKTEDHFVCKAEVPFDSTVEGSSDSTAEVLSVPTAEVPSVPTAEVPSVLTAETPSDTTEATVCAAEVKDKSCFDFEDNDEAINLDKSHKFGQKLPRVINDEKFNKKVVRMEVESSNSKPEAKTPEVSPAPADDSAALQIKFHELLKDTEMSKVPEIPENNILVKKCSEDSYKQNELMETNEQVETDVESQETSTSEKASEIKVTDQENDSKLLNDVVSEEIDVCDLSVVSLEKSEDKRLISEGCSVDNVQKIEDGLTINESGNVEEKSNKREDIIISKEPQSGLINDEANNESVEVTESSATPLVGNDLRNFSLEFQETKRNYNVKKKKKKSKSKKKRGSSKKTPVEKISVEKDVNKEPLNLVKVSDEKELLRENFEEDGDSIKDNLLKKDIVQPESDEPNQDADLSIMHKNEIEHEDRDKENLMVVEECVVEQSVSVREEKENEELVSDQKDDQSTDKEESAGTELVVNEISVGEPVDSEIHGTKENKISLESSVEKTEQKNDIAVSDIAVADQPISKIDNVQHENEKENLSELYVAERSGNLALTEKDSEKDNVELIKSQDPSIIAPIKEFSVIENNDKLLASSEEISVTNDTVKKAKNLYVEQFKEESETIQDTENQKSEIENEESLSVLSGTVAEDEQRLVNETQISPDKAFDDITNLNENDVAVEARKASEDLIETLPGLKTQEVSSSTMNMREIIVNAESTENIENKIDATEKQEVLHRRVVIEKDTKVAEEMETTKFFDVSSEIVIEKDAEVAEETKTTKFSDVSSEIVIEKDAEVAEETKTSKFFDVSSEIVIEKAAELAEETKTTKFSDVSSEIVIEKDAKVVEETKATKFSDVSSEIVIEQDAKVTEETKATKFSDVSSEIQLSDKSLPIQEHVPPMPPKKAATRIDKLYTNSSELGTYSNELVNVSSDLPQWTAMEYYADLEAQVRNDMEIDESKNVENIAGDLTKQSSEDHKVNSQEITDINVVKETKELEATQHASKDEEEDSLKLKKSEDSTNDRLDSPSDLLINKSKSSEAGRIGVICDFKLDYTEQNACEVPLRTARSKKRKWESKDPNLKEQEVNESADSKLIESSIEEKLEVCTVDNVEKDCEVENLPESELLESANKRAKLDLSTEEDGLKIVKEDDEGVMISKQEEISVSEDTGVVPGEIVISTSETVESLNVQEPFENVVSEISNNEISKSEISTSETVVNVTSVVQEATICETKEQLSSDSGSADKKEVEKIEIAATSFDPMQMELDINSMPVVIEEDLMQDIKLTPVTSVITPSTSTRPNMKQIRIQLRKAGDNSSSLLQGTQNGKVIRIPGTAKETTLVKKSHQIPVGSKMQTVSNIIPSRALGGTGQTMVLKMNPIQSSGVQSKYAVSKTHVRTTTSGNTGQPVKLHIIQGQQQNTKLIMHSQQQQLGGKLPPRIIKTPASAAGLIGNKALAPANKPGQKVIINQKRQVINKNIITKATAVAVSKASSTITTQKGSKSIVVAKSGIANQLAKNVVLPAVQGTSGTGTVQVVAPNVQSKVIVQRRTKAVSNAVTPVKGIPTQAGTIYIHTSQGLVPASKTVTKQILNQIPQIPAPRPALPPLANLKKPPMNKTRQTTANILQRNSKKNTRQPATVQTQVQPQVSKQQLLSIPASSLSSHELILNNLPVQFQNIGTTQQATDVKMLYLVDERGQYHQVDNSPLIAIDNSGDNRGVFIESNSNTDVDNLFLTFGDSNVTVPTTATTPTQDILAKALANTQVLQSDTTDIADTIEGATLYVEPQYPAPTLTHNVLETSFSLNPPIMSPLEVPSSVSPQITPISTNLIPVTAVETIGKKDVQPSMPLLTDDVEVAAGQTVFLESGTLVSGTNQPLTFQVINSDGNIVVASTSSSAHTLANPVNTNKSTTTNQVIFSTDLLKSDSRQLNVNTANKGGTIIESIVNTSQSSEILNTNQNDCVVGNTQTVTLESVQQQQQDGTVIMDANRHIIQTPRIMAKPRERKPRKDSLSGEKRLRNILETEPLHQQQQLQTGGYRVGVDIINSTTVASSTKTTSSLSSTTSSSSQQQNLELTSRSGNVVVEDLFQKRLQQDKSLNVATNKDGEEKSEMQQQQQQQQQQSRSSIASANNGRTAVVSGLRFNTTTRIIDATEIDPKFIVEEKR